LQDFESIIKKILMYYLFIRVVQCRVDMYWLNTCADVQSRSILIQLGKYNMMRIWNIVFWKSPTVSKVET